MCSLILSQCRDLRIGIAWYQEHSFSRSFIPGNESALEHLFPGHFGTWKFLTSTSAGFSTSATDTVSGRNSMAELQLSHMCDLRTTEEQRSSNGRITCTQWPLAVTTFTVANLSVLTNPGRCCNGNVQLGHCYPIILLTYKVMKALQTYQKVCVCGM